jgi:DNA repair exonuclease SbcCD nuclease subunit
VGHGSGLYEGRLAEQEQVWRSILELARTEHVDAVLCAGDVWERRKPTPAEMLAAERPLVEHRDANGCPVLVILGNHDVAGTDTTYALDVLAEAGLITLSTRPEVIDVAGLAVCTLPWTPVARLVAEHPDLDRDNLHEDIGRLLVDVARKLREEATGPAILLGHWSVTGASLPSGLPIELAREVIVPLDEIEQLGFDANVLSHIHRSQVLTPATGITTPGPAFYTGSPLALNHGEGGYEHGVWLLDLHVVMGRANPEITFIPLDSRAFVTVDLGFLSGTDNLDGAIVRVKDTITVDQADNLDVDAVRSTAIGRGAHHVTVEITVERESRARAAGLDETATVADAFDAWLEAEHIDDTLRDELRPLHHHYEEAVA